MSKGKQLFQMVGQLFAKSFQPISERLSADELNAFADEAQGLQGMLDEKTNLLASITAEAADLKGQLSVANEAFEKATSNLAEAGARIAELEANLTAAQDEAGTYKSHYQKAAARGANLPDEDATSRGQEVADYNAAAMEIFVQSRRK
jgi:chromosome segregation ATPase